MTRFFRFLRLKAVSRENDRKMEEKRPSLKDIKRLSLSIPFFKGLAEGNRPIAYKKIKGLGFETAGS